MVAHDLICMPAGPVIPAFSSGVYHHSIWF